MQLLLDYCHVAFNRRKILRPPLNISPHTSDADKDFLSSSGLRGTLERLCAEKESDWSDWFPLFMSVLRGFSPTLGPDLQLG